MMARILIEAIQKGDESRAKDIIRNGSYPGIDCQTSHRDGTALFFCCSRGYLELATLLIERGAKANSEDKNSATPLHAAADNGHSDVVRLLIRNGADLGAQTFRGDTPLHLAAFRGDGEICRLLVEAGADSRLVNTNAFTPENEARIQGHKELGKYLRAVQNVRYPDESSDSSFDMMIPVGPPTADWMSQSTSQHKQQQQPQQQKQQQQQQHQTEKLLVDIQPLNQPQVLQRRVSVCPGDVQLRSKAQNYNDLNFIQVDPPTNLPLVNCPREHSSRPAQRHSTSMAPIQELVPLKSPSRSSPQLAVNIPPPMCQVTHHKSKATKTASPGQSPLNVFPEDVPPALRSPYLSPLRQPPTAPLSSAFLSPSSYMAGGGASRRPSTGSMNSCNSDISGGTGSDIGSLPSTGSDGSGCLGEARRDDVEPPVKHCLHSSHEGRDLLDLPLGVRFPPGHRQFHATPASSMSVDSSDFSDIYESSLFSLNSLVSGPPSSSVSMNSYSSGEHSHCSHGNDLNRLGHGNFIDPDNVENKAKKRPVYNKSISADYRPGVCGPRLQPTEDGFVHSLDLMYSNDLSSPRPSRSSSSSTSRRPSASMTCVNIPLN